MCEISDTVCIKYSIVRSMCARSDFLKYFTYSAECFKLDEKRAYFFRYQKCSSTRLKK